MIYLPLNLISFYRVMSKCPGEFSGWLFQNKFFISPARGEEALFHRGFYLQEILKFVTLVYETQHNIFRHGQRCFRAIFPNAF